MSNVGNIFDGHDECNEYTHETNYKMVEAALDKIYAIVTADLPIDYDPMERIMLSIEDHEFLSEVIHLLDQREIEVERPFWFINSRYDESDTFCWDCLHLVMPKAELGEDFMGGGWDEHDAAECCIHCGKLLKYTLTDYGVDNELEHFMEVGFDWNFPQECFELCRIAHGLYTDEQKLNFLMLIDFSFNAPSELVIAAEQLT